MRLFGLWLAKKIAGQLVTEQLVKELLVYLVARLNALAGKTATGFDDQLVKLVEDHEDAIAADVADFINKKL